MYPITVRQFLVVALAGIILSNVPAGSAQRESPPQKHKVSLKDRSQPVVTAKSEPPPSPIGAKLPVSQRMATNQPVVSNAPVVGTVKTTVEVNAEQQALQGGLAAPYHITSSEVLSSAGTWGDFSRFLQLLPGAVWNSDMSNDVLVRGGNPSENLFVVDGIEVPNINHIALEGTTGGFTSMIDTSTIGSVDMKPGEYDAGYSSRLSSLIEIHTREGLGVQPAAELDMGISGAGGFVQRPLGDKASFLLSAHRSVLNLVTNDIGINGVPIYTNGLAQLEWSPRNNDHVSVLSLDGADSINITPEPCDNGVTLQVQTQYAGSRSTNGFVWQHMHTPSVVSTVTASYSAQNQNIGQQWQTTTYSNTPSCFSAPIQSVPVYQEQTHDGISTLNYGLQWGRGNWFYSLGVIGRLVALNYNVAQPLGQQSPLNVNPAWTDADSFARRLMTGQTGSYAEVMGSLGSRWSLIAGVREETFALVGAQAFEPRASLAFRINGHQSLNGDYSRSAQLVPWINILSYAGNASLRPMQAEQFSAGAELWQGKWASVSIETYRKRYTNEPVSTEYPSLMLANMVDTLGQQFVWLPLKSGGHGQAEGIELLMRAHAGERFRIMGSASYSRTRYAAGDGVMRPGNFDFPLVSNGLATIELPGKIEFALRDTYASGRPYTPFNIVLSEKQSRGIYDLSQVNALRGSAYNRVDADINRNFHIRHRPLNVHAGLENAFNRQNFLGYAWEDNCKSGNGATMCGMNVNEIPGVPETKVIQMPRFPNAGIRYIF